MNVTPVAFQNTNKRRSSEEDDMENDPMEQINTLMERVREVVSGMGLDMMQFAVIPSMHPGQPNMVQAVLGITEDAFKDDEQKAFDAQFKEIEMDLRREQQKDKILNAHEGAKKLFEELGGDEADLAPAAEIETDGAPDESPDEPEPVDPTASRYASPDEMPPEIQDFLKDFGLGGDGLAGV